MQVSNICKWCGFHMSKITLWMFHAWYTIVGPLWPTIRAEIWLKVPTITTYSYFAYCPARIWTIQALPNIPRWQPWIWESRNLEMQKSGIKQKIQRIQILKSKSVSPKMLARSGLVRKKTPPSPICGHLRPIFPWTKKYKNCLFLLAYFPWWASPGLGPSKYIWQGW